MTDRELLEAAARAAGLTDWYWSHGDKTIKLHGTDVGYEWPEPQEWNPLTDDGDALRLAVRLRISVHNGDGYVSVGRLRPVYTLDPLAHELTDRGDPDAATRRAIVRAAAEMAAKERP